MNLAIGIIIDLIIVGLIALSVFLGYKKGLAKCLIKILSFFIALIFAAFLFKPVSNAVIEMTEIDDGIRDGIVSIVSNDINEEGEVKEDTNLPTTMVDYINNTVKNAAEEAKNNIVQTVADGIAVAVINLGSFIFLFCVMRLLLFIVSLVSSLFTDLPVIKQFDKTGGVIYGLLRALIVVFVVFALISLISPLIEGTGIIAAIDKSFIGGFLYNNNLLVKLIFNK